MPYEKLTNISLADPAVQALTIHRVIDPERAYGMRRMVSEHGYKNSLMVVTKLLIRADVLLGGDGDLERCKDMAASYMVDNSHRSFGFLILCIREGLRSKEKSYGKLTAPLLQAWVALQEEAIMNIVHGEHPEGDDASIGKDFLDRLEERSREDRRIKKMGKMIDRLKKKLGEQ